jgi:hypothetical protein
MSGFVKVDCGIVNSSLWIERDQRSLFLTALFMAEPFQLKRRTAQLHVRSLDPTGWMVPPGWYGIIHAAGSGIIRRDGCDEEVGYHALEALGAADPESRSHEYEGRRLVRIDGGYLVLNYFLYRDRDYTSAARAKRYRDKKKRERSSDDASRRDDTASHRNVTQAEAYTEAEAKGGRRAQSPRRASHANSNGNDTLETGELVQRIRSFAVKPLQGSTVIPLTEVEKLGPDVLRAYKALGGSARFLDATGKDYSFLVKEFGQALAAARQDGAWHDHAHPARPARDAERRDHWVYAPCDQLIVGYWCDVHKVQMPNREAAVDHCGEPGDHAIARWCTTHGFESTPPQRTPGEKRMTRRQSTPPVTSSRSKRLPPSSRASSVRSARRSRIR